MREEAAQGDASARQQVKEFQSTVDALSVDNDELRAQLLGEQKVCVQLVQRVLHHFCTQWLFAHWDSGTAAVAGICREGRAAC